MKKLILDKLKELSKEHDITMLYACESGSRAWGFPSPDSDYDVRFIYVHKPDWYLSLSEGKDTINLPIDKHELDITGWELRKGLRLLKKSNASPLEWIQSPIVYGEVNGFKQKFSELAADFFSPVAVAHHYHSMSLKYIEACVGKEEVKLKSYFYALRTTLAVSWIRKMNTMAPIVFADMLELVEAPVRRRIEELMEIKSRENESYLSASDKLIDAFLSSTFEANGVKLTELSAGNGDFSVLNDFFIKTVKGGYK
ncbi:MAG: nucleotidyltransferase domain-containing protein [Roseivirga sp.]|nr:nucleotidyltransferase domain-containing protein [Roseivirga sp.]